MSIIIINLQSFIANCFALVFLIAVLRGSSNWLIIIKIIAIVIIISLMINLYFKSPFIEREVVVAVVVNLIIIKSWGIIIIIVNGLDQVNF